MGWLDQINSAFVITTGDGKEFRPQWMNATKAKEFNVAEFNFINQEGTLVKRRKAKGRRFNMEIFFQGDDNLDVAREFDISSSDSRAWTILHPVYGTLIVQPLGLTFNDSQHNVTKITGIVVETIVEDNPQAITDPVDKIDEDKEALDATFEESFATDVIPSTTDKNTLSSNLNTIFKAGEDLAGDISEDYLNAFNSAEAAILDATDEPLAAIQAIDAVITLPAFFVQSIQNRLRLFKNQFDRLSTDINGIIEASKKKIYESNVGIIISTMALASANPIEGDYANRPDVIDRIDEILAVYNAYIDNLDILQTDNGGTPESYIPNSESLTALNDLINFTVSNLFDIALNTSQERSIIVEKDSNVILLTHRIYGLDAEDTLMDQLIENNKIGILELLKIPKGRKILYYI